jgi:hypothetical protein
MSDDDKTSAAEEHIVEIQYANFMVADRPYCLWDYDISLTRRFLEGIDPKYFEYVADTHLDEAVDNQSMQASLAIRTAYSQALETLFAFIGATLQAPHCVPAWLALYTNRDLRDIVGWITDRKPLPSVLDSKTLSWQLVSEFVHTNLVLDDAEEQERIKAGYAKLWARFASDFLNTGFTNEYNSIKHGLRVKPGGSYVAFRREDEPGKPSPTESRTLAGKSEYGSSYYVFEKLLDKTFHIRLVQHFHLWHPEDFAYGLILISMSIQNVISALRILNAVPADEVRFTWLTEEETLQEPWKRAIKQGVKSWSVSRRSIPDELIKPYSKEREEIRSLYLDKKYLRTIRWQLNQGAEDEVKED